MIMFLGHDNYKKMHFFIFIFAHGRTFSRAYSLIIFHPYFINFVYQLIAFIIIKFIIFAF